MPSEVEAGKILDHRPTPSKEVKKPSCSPRTAERRDPKQKRSNEPRPPKQTIDMSKPQVKKREE